ncbi:MAG: response regulator [Reinekea forsetii]|nr:response regulator [Reinekea forsetii]
MESLDLKHKKALVVDDFANVRQSITAMLEDLGFVTVHEASDGDSATKLVRESKYDLVLCDFNLGLGRDGMRLLEEWRRLKLMPEDTIFVLITGETSRSVVISAIEFQPDDYLAKPFTLDVLSVRLGRWFERRKVLLPMLVSIDKKDWKAVANTAKSIDESYPRYRSTAQKHYVEALIRQKKMAEAETFLFDVLEKRYQCWAQTALHRIELLQKKLETAEIGLKAVLELDPNELIAYDYLVDSLVQQEKDEEAQTWLEEVISRAPRSIDRQLKLVKVAQTNLNFRRANQAQKDILNLATDTMHESVGLFQNYIKNLKDEALSSDNTRKRDIEKEIVFTAKRMQQSFAADFNAELFTRGVEIQDAKDVPAIKTTQDLDELYNDIINAVDRLIPETALFMAELYYSQERFNDADEMIRAFKICFSDQPEFIEILDALQAEPISLILRSEAKVLNGQGMELYDQEKYPESVRFFEKALKVSPRHPGIVLNFVQAHLHMMEARGKNDQTTAMCLETISRLFYLSEEHYQYPRYKKLLDNVEKL